MNLTRDLCYPHLVSGLAYFILAVMDQSDDAIEDVELPKDGPEVHNRNPTGRNQFNDCRESPQYQKLVQRVDSANFSAEW